MHFCCKSLAQFTDFSTNICELESGLPFFEVFCLLIGGIWFSSLNVSEIWPLWHTYNYQLLLLIKLIFHWNAENQFENSNDVHLCPWLLCPPQWGGKTIVRQANFRNGDFSSREVNLFAIWLLHQEMAENRALQWFSQLADESHQGNPVFHISLKKRAQWEFFCFMFHKLIFPQVNLSTS